MVNLLDLITKRKLDRNIFKIYIISLFGGFAFFYNEIVSLYYSSFDINFVSIGTILAVMLAVKLIFEIPSGAFADLYGRKKSMFIGAFLSVVGLIITAFGSTFSVFLVASVFFGLGMAFISGAYNALIYDSLKLLKREKEYLKVLTRDEFIFLSVGIVSAYFGPYLFSFNVRLPYFVGSLFGIVWALSILTLYEPEVKHKVKNTLRAHYVQMKDGLIYTFTHSKIIWYIFFSALFAIVAYAIGNLIAPPYVIEKGFTYQQLGIFALIWSGLQAIGSFFIDKLENKIGEKLSVILIILGVFVSLMITYFSSSYLIGVVQGLFWFLISFNFLVVDNYINKNLTSKNRATVMSIHSMFSSLSVIIFLPLIGYVIDVKSLSYSIFVLAIVTLIVGLILFFVRTNKTIWKSLDW